MNGAIIVNSVLAFKSQCGEHSSLGRFDFWGWRPSKNDCLIMHRVERWAILVRYFLKGLDLPVCIKLFRALKTKKYQSVYIVTTPDVLRALPWFKKRFPSVKFAVWTWEIAGARGDCPHILSADAIFCLTEGGYHWIQNQVQQHKKTDRTAAMPDVRLSVIGAQPIILQADANPRKYEVALVGNNQRCIEDAIPALQDVRGRIVAASQYRDRIAGEVSDSDQRIDWVDGADFEACFDAFKSSEVSWIPLYLQEPNAHGYTGFAASLMCGASALIADSTVIPRHLLALPGAVAYQAGLPSDLKSKHQAEIARRSKSYITKILEKANQEFSYNRWHEEIADALK